MAMPSKHDEDIADLLVDLENAAHIPAKQRAVKISNLVERVCLKAYEDGLLNASLNKLVDIITLPNELDQASVGSLIRNLYPASKVPHTIVVKVVGSLGHGRSKPSYTTQAAFLKWLVMVYDVLETPKVLSQLYAILFNLLDTIAIRPQLCHVISLITRRHHVRPFRIQALMELTRQAGNEPPLVGLMRVYKDYYPDVIVGDVVAGRASVFTHPNHEWRERLGEIQAVHFQRTQDGLAPQRRAFRATRQGTDGATRAKRSVIPEVQTSRAQETSTTLEEIEDVNDFIRKLEMIELPNQLVAVLGDPLLQKLLLLKSSETISRRVEYWLLAFFEDQLQSAGSGQVQILEMLEAVREYARYTKQLPPACLSYLKSMTHLWNGVTGREVVLDLLTYIPIGSFEELYKLIFEPLEEAILDGSTESKLALISFYKNLLDQWTVDLLAGGRPPTITISAINSLVDHTNILALTIAQSSLTVATLSEILSFYECTASLISHPALKSSVRITIPPAELIYILHFTESVSTLSRLCAILALYKRAFEIAMAPKPANSSVLELQSYPKDYVNHFNGFLMDICNCVWRSRAFNTSDLNALGCLLPAPIVPVLTKYVSGLNSSLSLPTLFSLSFSPVYCLLAISYVREVEDQTEEDIEVRHPGPPTQTSLKQLERDGGLKLSWADYRLGVLHYLENKGVPGVGELMYNTMKHLMSARENRAQA